MNVFTSRTDRAAPAQPAVAPCLWLAIAAALPLPAGNGAGRSQRNFFASAPSPCPSSRARPTRSPHRCCLGRLDLGAYGRLRLAGLTLQHNLMGERSAWAFGPLVSLRAEARCRRRRRGGAHAARGRRRRRVRRLRRVRLPRCARRRRPPRPGRRGQGRQGQPVLADRRATWRPGRAPSSSVPILRVVYANDRYMDSYFSIDADNSARSGLPLYTATSGVKNISLGFTGIVRHAPATGCCSAASASRACSATPATARSCSCAATPTPSRSGWPSATGSERLRPAPTSSGATP